MSGIQDDKDQAFPCYVVIEADGHFAGVARGPRGLTKRELFAAMALQGRCTYTDGLRLESAGEMAASAVRLADALIAELAK